MATSGTIQTNTEYESYFWVSWSQISQDVANNKTKIHWSCNVHCGHRFYYNAITMSSVTINGIQIYAGGTYSDFGNGDHEIASGDLDILHNSDGTKTFTVGGFTGWLYENHNYSASAQSFTLTTIPRASTMTVPSFTIGSSGTMTITRASSAFTHTIRYAFGSASGTVVTKTSSTSVSWTPPASLLDQIPSSVSGTGTLYLDTYSGNTLIGTKQYSFTASAASSVKPSCSFTFSDPTGLRTTFGACVQGQSKLSISVTGTPNHSSPIKSYKVNVDGKEYNSASVTTSVLRGTGTLTIKATVTDARGRTSAESTQTITVLVYAAPVLTISAYRCNSSGVRDEEGAYMKFALSSVISSLNSQNSATWRIRYKKSSESNWTTLSGSGTSYTSSVIAADLSALYNVEATVTDRIVGTTKAASVPISYVLMDFYNSGKGIAFGRVATEDGFVCGMDANFEKSVKKGSLFSAGNLAYDDAVQSANLSAGSWYKIGEVTYESGGYTRGAVFGIVITGIYSTRQPQAILAVCVASYNYLSLIKIGSTDTAYKPFDQMRVCHNDATATVDVEIHAESSTSSGVAAGNATRVRILQLSDCTVSAKTFTAAGGKTVKSTITL